jgi:hypothetical protein
LPLTSTTQPQAGRTDVPYEYQNQREIDEDEYGEDQADYDNEENDGDHD